MPRYRGIFFVPNHLLQKVGIIKNGLCPFIHSTYPQQSLCQLGLSGRRQRPKGLVRAPLETPQPLDIEKHNSSYQTKLDVNDGTSCTGINWHIVHDVPEFC